METGGNGRSHKTLPSTPGTGDPADFGALLSALTDDELRRYGEIAEDQRQIEYDRWWAEVGLWSAAAVSFIWAVWQIAVLGFSTRAAMGLAAAVACAYWPWRKMRMRRLWQGHCEAVAQEQARRGTRAD